MRSMSQEPLVPISMVTAEYVWSVVGGLCDDPSLSEGSNRRFKVLFMGPIWIVRNFESYFL
jgi:hypothetical protein